MGRLDIDRQKELEPKRLKQTKKALEDMGYEVEELSLIHI